MDVTLAFVCLGDKQVRYVPANAILVRHCVSTKNFLKPILKSVNGSKDMVQYLRAGVD